MSDKKAPTPHHEHPQPEQHVHPQPAPQPQSDPDVLGLPKRNGTGKKVMLVIVTAIITALIVGGGTWYYMNRKLETQKTNMQNQIDQLNSQLSTQNKTSSSSSTTSVTLKNLTTKYEKLSFSYPASYTLTDTSKANPSGPVEGSDVILLNGPNGFYVNLQTGLYGVGGGCDKCKVLKTEPITILNKQYYINYVSADGGPTVDYLVVGDSPTGIITFVKGKTLNVDGTPALISVRAGYATGEKQISKTLAEWQSDPNLTTFKQILQSFSY